MMSILARPSTKPNWTTISWDPPRSTHWWTSNCGHALCCTSCSLSRPMAHLFSATWKRCTRSSPSRCIRQKSIRYLQWSLEPDHVRRISWPTSHKKFNNSPAKTCWSTHLNCATNTQSMNIHCTRNWISIGVSHPIPRTWAWDLQAINHRSILAVYNNTWSLSWPKTCGSNAVPTRTRMGTCMKWCRMRMPKPTMTETKANSKATPDATIHSLAHQRTHRCTKGIV